MIDYTLSKTDRQEVDRLNRRIDIAMLERDLFLRKAAERLEIPWRVFHYDPPTAAFTEASNSAGQPLSGSETTLNPKKPPGGA